MNKNVAELDKNLIEMCKKAKIPGMALIAAKNGEVIYENYVGYRNKAAQLPVTGDTIFGVASLTKSFTALAIMILEEEGKLSVQDNVIKWLPQLTFIQPKTTIHHLLTHTAGYPGMASFHLARLESLTRDPDGRYLFGKIPTTNGAVKGVPDMMEKMNEFDEDFIGAPGELFNYSNECYALLQEIVERASGESFEELMKRMIFEPIEMDRSIFKVADLRTFSDVTQLYAFTKDKKKDAFHSPTWWESGNIYGAGALKASAKDMMKYLEVFRNDGNVNGKQIVSKKGIDKMLTAYCTTPNENQYGYGMMIGNYNGVDVVGHGGGVKGVSSYMLLAKKEGITITVLTNIAEVAAENLALTVFRYLLDLEEPKLGQSAYQLSTEELTKYSGIYQSHEGQKIEVREKENGLVLHIQHNTVTVAPYQENLFQLPDGKKVAFLTDGQGNITGIFRGMRYLQKCT
ncbi:serine hydrolase domain-containing protein [Pseudogracilibacillus auburnensis]|uniref:serine hydrolase domain-containing protein n=1 Tax=Pseudogracilibacillus auburnensis TaxID=1494959 RepID=UPI001A9756E2|nr:serine hydrolase domain-containing protein [Pseudogracilibacillus auburnensis]MBO1005435.1 serine hydrolase [Pseudogracilibacillus auburnensis]